MCKRTKSKRERGNGWGHLEKHGRIYRAWYFKVDPNAPSGFSRAIESTGVRVDGTSPEDRDPVTGAPDPENARARAERWLEDHTAPYRKLTEHGKLTEDASKVARVMSEELAKTQGMVEKKASEAAEALDKLPAYTLEAAWVAFDGDLTSRKRDPATHRNYEQWYHLFTAWLEGTHKEMTELRHVTAAVAREYARTLLERVRGTTYNRHLNALSLIWATLAAHDLDGSPVYPEAKLGGNPFAYDKATKSGIPRIKLEKEDRPHRRRDLTLEEIAKLLTTATGEMRVLLALGFYTGLRLGDLALLKFSNVDRVLGTIAIRSHKTDTATETAIHPTLARIMAENVTATSGYILPEVAKLYNGGTTGRVELTRRIAEIFKACGIETSYKAEGEKRARPEAGFHSLRHSYATQLERARVALEDRRRLMGHASAAMTQHYTHAETGAPLALPDLMSMDGTTGAADAGQALTPADGADAPEGTLASVYAMVDGMSKTELRKLAKFITQKLGK